MELASTPKGWLKKGIAHFGNKNAIGGLSIGANVALPLLVDTYYNDSQNIIKYSNTRILLKANKKYRLIADGVFKSSSGGDYTIAFFDVTNNIKLGSEFYAGASNVPDTWTRQSQAFAIVNPTTDIYVELRNISSTISEIYYSSKVIIEELETYTLQTPKVLDKMVGVGQTLQNVTANRALGTTYTNTTGKPIEVTVICVNNAGGASNHFSLYVNGEMTGTINLGYSQAYTETSLSCIVPINATYMANVNYGVVTLQRWTELR